MLVAFENARDTKVQITYPDAPNSFCRIVSGSFLVSGFENWVATVTSVERNQSSSRELSYTLGKVLGLVLVTQAV